jgi:dCTP deaminase
MTYSDHDIMRAMGSGQIRIDPFTTDDLQPASIDMHLGDTFKIIRPNSERKTRPVIDPRVPIQYEEVGPCEEFVLFPNDFVLAPTVERITINNCVVGRMEGKSSLGRMGLIIHSTAGLFDPGFDGQATLELSNLTEWPLVLYPGMAICQFSVAMLMTPSRRAYGDKALGSKYQGQEGPTESRIHENFQVREGLL